MAKSKVRQQRTHQAYLNGKVAVNTERLDKARTECFDIIGDVYYNSQGHNRWVEVYQSLSKRKPNRPGTSGLDPGARGPYSPNNARLRFR